MNTIKIDHKNTKMVAHRGVSGLEKENTCAAFIAAGNRSYFGIETDIHPTLDGRFVCIHDGNTRRVAMDSVDVENSTLETLRSVVLCDIDDKKGRADLRIPTLEEYVQLCKKYGKVGVCEIKDVFSRENIEKVVEIVKGEDYLDGIIFIAFDMENLTVMREILPDQPCQFLCGEVDEALVETLKQHKLDLDIYYNVLTAEKVKMCHDNGIKINAWTVDDPAEAEKLVEWGVDYITSNILE